MWISARLHLLEKETTLTNMSELEDFEGTVIKTASALHSGKQLIKSNQTVSAIHIVAKNEQMRITDADLQLLPLAVFYTLHLTQ